MALDKDYFDNLAVDMKKKRFFSVSEVETLVEDFRRETEVFKGENVTLREELDKLNSEKDLVREVINSAKEIAQQLIADTNEEADRILTEANGKAEKLLSEATEEAQQLLSEATEKADSLVAEASEQADKILDEANVKAANTVAEANEKADGLIREINAEGYRAVEKAVEREEYATLCVQNVLEKMKARQVEAINIINEEYQNFLVGLYSDDEEDSTEEETAAEDVPEVSVPDSDFEISVPDKSDEAVEAVNEPAEEKGSVPYDLEEKVGAIAKALAELAGDKGINDDFVSPSYFLDPKDF